MTHCNPPKITNPGGPYVPGDCRLCWLEQDQGRKGRIHRRERPAVFSGGAKQRDHVTLVPCPGCPGNVRIKAPKRYVWSCGVTTVPERGELLRRTLASLHAGGFDAPRLFVDGWDGRDNRFADLAARTTARHHRIGAWGNWWMAAWEMWIRQPHADLYAIFQDDLVVCRNLRAYVEACLPTIPPKTYLNPFLFLHNEELHGSSPRGWHDGALCPSMQHRPDGHKWQQGVGALALIFTREAMRVLLRGGPGTVDKPADEDYRCAQQRIDGQVVDIFNNAGWRELTHVPSLVGHMGELSSLDRRHPDIVAREPDGPRKVWRRAAATFPGEAFDALSLLRVGAMQR